LLQIYREAPASNLNNSDERHSIIQHRLWTCRFITAFWTNLMRILLTGTGGQVGGALLPILGQSHELLAPPRAEFDLSKPDTLGPMLDRLNPELIINPAAYTAVDRAEDEFELALRVNAESPAVLGHWAARQGVPFVHFSTDYVFDGSGAEPWREDDSCNPLSSYGRSKWEGEKAILSSGAPHLIIRTSWVYAARGTNFLCTISRLACEREELRIVADQFGCPTSASSIADAVSMLISRKSSSARIAQDFAAAEGMVHLTNTGVTSWHGFATAIVDGLRAKGVPVKTTSIHAISSQEFPAKAVRPANSRLDLSRLERAFGLVTPPWQLALERELDLLVRLGQRAF
jgi:dTDP-4-dehydrorhamnose reductase